MSMPGPQPIDLFTLAEVEYAVTRAVHGEFLNPHEHIPHLVRETAHILTTQLSVAVGDRVAADGSNATLTVSGENLPARIDPTSAMPER